MNNNFNPVVGYAGFENINNQKLLNKIYVINEIVNRYAKVKCEGKMLVAGCGDGTEAILMKNVFNYDVFGVDISLTKDELKDKKCQLFIQDIGNLKFNDNYFDFIYSYHVLEHVPSSELVLKELWRVLNIDSILFIGFPNKNRLVGYVGTHNYVSWKEKLIWNLKDYRDRILGRFENRLGAHAGFKEKEFMSIAKSIFREVIPVRNDYMKLKHTKIKLIVNLIINLKLSEVLFPSNYYICIK